MSNSSIIIDPTTKKAALLSGVLHLFAIFFMVLGLVFTSLFAKEDEPYIFEMVALPESVDAFEPDIVEPLPELSLDLPEFEPVEITEPEPVVEPPPPEPVVQLPPPKPVVQPPPPVPVEKPKPKIISYEDFVKEHGKPEAPKTPPKPKPVKPRKIDTSKIENNLRRLSVPELSLATTSTIVDSDVMNQWRSALAARLDLEWKKSKTEGTAGKAVRISFYISSGGAISNVKVVQSSGLTELDRIGINTLLQLGSFQPPPSGKGETVIVLLRVE